MSLTPAKMENSLKDQLLQEERDLKAELAAVEKDKARASKKGVVSKLIKKLTK